MEKKRSLGVRWLVALVFFKSLLRLLLRINEHLRNIYLCYYCYCQSEHEGHGRLNCV